MNGYLIKAGELVTVSPLGTIQNGGMVIDKGKIVAIDTWRQLEKRFPALPIVDYSNATITPSLVDCHTHLLEFAPSSLYPVTPATHFLAAKAILLKALSSGITAIGEQICGHPLCRFSVQDYREIVQGIPLDVSFATVSISIGFSEPAHFSAITQSRPITIDELKDPFLIRKIARESEFPGENIFINATPANFTENEVPRAGEIIYELEDLKQAVSIYHQMGKKIGVHVAGEESIRMAIEAGVDVLHHAHGITDVLIEKVATTDVKVVATPLGGTHLKPNSPSDILKLVKKGIAVSIATDAYLPPHPEADWLPFTDGQLRGVESLLAIAQPTMRLLQQQGYDENQLLALITANPAEILGKDNHFGRLLPGMDANFIICDGIPGLEFSKADAIQQVYFRGKKVIAR
ncbi:amidohydrolase family protein [Sporosarcina sp. HYO08]|uniref:amidohydrolase family protein n=1 Tax=Sporosarcina sp. HYO08 TaxID=1759557 RepID=UPI0007925F4B|nr:amidohydrolase family protein [Sporosarcina sp. HYO08]KXH81868.1 hypothetical protein AU377_06285 [Sporosarcina sp. HYO08]